MGEWIKNVGSMPVPRGTPIEVRHRDGEEIIDRVGYGYAEDWSLDPNNEEVGDIMEYRMI